MHPALISGFKSMVLLSDRPAELATFYQETLGLPLEREQHRGTRAHWACMVGALHMAIHPRHDFWLAAADPGAEAGTGTVVSFDVADLGALRANLDRLGIAVQAENRIGPMTFVAFRDPEGRWVSCGTPWPRSAR
jgi:catechol 2,3-dioxygenase-like lactoylglutathione lyase family enzyme